MACLFILYVFYSFQCTNLLPPYLCPSSLSFDPILNGIFYIIFFLDSSLLVYKNIAYFCVLILYPATFLNIY